MDPHIQYLLNQRTPGASGAWNTAIEYLSNKNIECTGSLFLAFLDDDDEWHPSYLKECLSVAIEKNCNMVSAGFYRYESEAQTQIECIPPNSLNEGMFLKGNPGIQASNLFLSLHIMLMAGGFDEELVRCTDRDLCIRLCELEATLYSNIHKPLLNHYADSTRQRLSTPNSAAKNNGLSVFWQKYNGRMSVFQCKAFLERALDLFNWKPEKSQQIESIKTLKIRLTLGIQLGSILFTQLSEIIKKIQQVDQNNLVDFHIVLTGTKEFDEDNLCEFIKLLNQLEISCYNLCDQQVCIDSATALVAKENASSCAWVLKAGKLQEQLSAENEDAVSETLTELGAHKLYNNSLNEQIQKPHTTLVQKIKQCRIKAAHARIKKLFGTGDLLLLGIGAEAIVLTDSKRVFKNIDYWKVRIPAEQIKFLKWVSSQSYELPGLYALDEVIFDGKTLVITYPYEKSTPYQGGNCEKMIDLMHSCSKAGFVCNNIHPNNLIKTQSEVKLIDYGSDIRPWNELGFEHMARRAYLTIYHADHPRLKYLMRQSLHTTNISEMQGYQTFRQRLTGIDCNLKQAQHACLPIAAPEVPPKPFALTIGVITGDAHKILPLLNSIAEFSKCSFLSNVSTIVLCNGCSDTSLKAVLKHSRRSLGNVQIISETQQIEDAESGLFGSYLAKRSKGQVGIAHSRSMLQKYVGLKCIKNPDSFAWIIDDDMRLDARTKQCLAWLPSCKQAKVDVVIGQYEGSSPNPPLHGLRGQLVDLVHNLRWLDNLPNDIELPDRSLENTILRDKFPDYYYDLSRKHTAHIETPFWLEPAYKGETVGEVRGRLFAHAPLLVTGFPLTRGIIPVCSTFPLESAKDTVNRGGNTFVLNAEALLQTPNLIPKINGREVRRSDMVWAMFNKYHHGLTIKSAPFPIQHIGRVQNEQTLNLSKVQDEIMGSALYAGLQTFLQTNEQHNLIFTDTEIRYVWQATKLACSTRISRLKHSFYRINGLAQALSKYPELIELNKYLARSFNPSTFTKLETQVKQMNEYHIYEFLNQIVPQSNCFAKAHQKTLERVE
jgi:glycosyltransferase involved in cell wall biosynthesis